MCGDSTDPTDVDRLFGNEKASLFETDPTYLVDYDSGEKATTNATRGRTKERWDYFHDAESAVEFYRKFLRAALPHLAPKTPIYQWHATIRQHLVMQAWTDAGIHLHQTIVWVKPRGVLGRTHYMWAHEPCFYGWVEGQKPKRKPPANAKTVWEIDGENDRIHLTQKPPEVFTRPIEYHTEIGDVVYEPLLRLGVPDHRGRASLPPLLRDGVGAALRRRGDLPLGGVHGPEGKAHGMSQHDSPIVSPDFALERDARGAVVHVRNQRSGECLGCIEVGLFEVLRALIIASLEPDEESLTMDLAISAHQSDVCRCL